MSEVKQEVRQFYDQVGWQVVDQDPQSQERIYQNAHYEDLRPVAYEYIHRCHLRLARYLKPQGDCLLDAGSGPIQYPEYLEYSKGYRYRVCADISIVALQEARRRIGAHGLFVVCDVANLPFKSDAFDGVVSLHTIHHLPEDEHLQAYNEIHRVLNRGATAAVVNGWPSSLLMDRFDPLIRLSNRLRGLTRRLLGGKPAVGGRAPSGQKKARQAEPGAQSLAPGEQDAIHNTQQETVTFLKGTFTNRHDVAWIKNEVGGRMPVQIVPWRSASVRFLRALIHPWLGGRLWLRLLYALEERYPDYFGANGQYPGLIIRKD